MPRMVQAKHLQPGDLWFYSLSTGAKMTLDAGLLGIPYCYVNLDNGSVTSCAFPTSQVMLLGRVSISRED